jgi:hypothetical protein
LLPLKIISTRDSLAAGQLPGRDQRERDAEQFKKDLQLQEKNQSEYNKKGDEGEKQAGKLEKDALAEETSGLLGAILGSLFI